MRKIWFVLLPAILWSVGLHAQEKQLTLEDAVINQWRGLAPEQLNGVVSYGDHDFSFVKDYSTIYKISGQTGEREDLYSLGELNKLRNESDLEPLPYFPYWDYEWLSEDLLAFKNGPEFNTVNIKKNEYVRIVELNEEAANLKQHKASGHIAYTLENNLYIRTADGDEIRVTNDDNKGIVNGDGYVHRQEFGIHEGIFWSPSGEQLAFYRKDETMVSDYPLVDITTRIATYKPIKYPMIGEKSEEVTLGIYDLKTKKTVFADVSDFTNERYLTSISWDPSGDYIYIGVLNREQKHLKLNKYNAKTGGFVQTLFEEKNQRYVEPENPLYFVKNKPDQFLWFSERDGYDHLYLYNTKGKLINQVTKGKWAVTGIEGFDDKGTTVYFTATKDSPIETHYYKADLKSGKISKLTSSEGVHQVVFSNSKKKLIDSYSSLKEPGKTALNDEKGKLIKMLVDSDNPLSDYNLGEMTIGTIKAADGETDLYYRMITPPDFDPKKKYPVIVYVYGGPHAQLVTNRWLGGASLWNHYMAQKGYVMFTLDNRGSANRGFEFESIIHRQCGQNEMEDQKKGIDFLLSKDFVDPDRIGVHGWSYGGFMTISLMLNYPEIFKTGVAGGPVTDWKYYEVMYGERYMDTPETNPEGFEKTSLLNKADQLEGRLQIIHGYQDPVVVPQHSIDFKRSVIKAGTDVDFFLYPESEHNMRGMTRLHLMKKVTRYFNDFLN
jgi:dipeptidyl-peptidase-4